MIPSDQLVNTGLGTVFVVCVVMGLWTVARTYVVHIVSADRPTRGVGRAIVASLPAAALALVLSNIPAWLIWQYDPVLASQAQTYAMLQVMQGVVVAFALLCLAGTVHAGIRQHVGAHADVAVIAEK